MKKLVFFIIFLVLILAILIVLRIKVTKEENVVEIEVVKKDYIQEVIKAYGFLEASKQVEIGSEVIGKIKRILVSKGDFVKKGDLVCIIDPTEYQAQRDRIKAILEQNLYELNLAKIDYEREKNLFEKKLISQKELEIAEARFKSLLFRIKQDSFNLKEYENRLQKCFIRSPIDGEVMEIYKKEGETVVPGTINNPASIIMVIGDKSKMIARCEVDETEIPKIKKGQKVKIKVNAFPDTFFSGSVNKIGGVRTSSLAQAQTQRVIKFPIEIEINEEFNLFLPGMSVSCEIITAEKESTITLPYSALGREKIKNRAREEFNTFLFVLKNRRAKKIYVKTGIRGFKRIEILSGLNISDTVIVGPEEVLRKLKDGEKVVVKPLDKRE
ncbi:MAG: efflux RND transporter periplasmic adaptor subunit [Candidatus Hydrothermales bacterium]